MPDMAILCRHDDCGGRPNVYDLEDAFAKTIIGGPGSFVVTVDDQLSFADAVRRKLILEIADIRRPGRDPSPDALITNVEDRG